MVNRPPTSAGPPAGPCAPDPARSRWPGEIERATAGIPDRGPSGAAVGETPTTRWTPLRLMDVAPEVSKIPGAGPPVSPNGRLGRIPTWRAT